MPPSLPQVHFRTNNPVQAVFDSSSAVLNQVWNGILTGQGSNMMSVPTDCDQVRLQAGWRGRGACRRMCGCMRVWRAGLCTMLGAVRRGLAAHGRQLVAAVPYPEAGARQ